MKRRIILSAAVACLLGCSSGTGGDDDSWTLAWSDEFTGPAGQLADPGNWTYETGTDWGNAQLEYDTDRASNAALDGAGNLVITARRESYEGRQYTSARLTTAGKREFQYGRFEARMKLPRGQGLWPAFWMLGANFDVVGWPASGEIDIMEFRGQEPSTILGSLHGPGYSGGSALTQRKTVTATRFDNSFHVFAVEWTAEEIRWFVDGARYHTVQREDVPGTWVFDHPFAILLNVAVGGNFVGAPSEVTTFPQQMVVDWVRVYQPAP